MGRSDVTIVVYGYMFSWRTGIVRHFFLVLNFDTGILRNVASILTLMFMFWATVGLAQKQLVLLKKEEVLLRLYPGDEFIYSLKGDKRKRTTYVNNISDTAVVTHRDTVPFHRIERIYFPQKRFYNTIGRALVIFGAGLFLIDQFNIVVVQGNSPDVDAGVSRISLFSVAAGLPLMLIKKRSQKMQHGIRLMMAEKSSPFYLPDTRQIISNEEN